MVALSFNQIYIMNSDSLPTPTAPEIPSLSTTSVVVAPSAEIRLQRILVPVDFSDASKNALKYAVALAKQFQATLLLLHVVEFNFVGSDLGAVELSQLEAEMQDNAEKQLATWAHQETSGWVSAEPLVSSGRPYSVIVETAQEQNMDLIIIATHGHSSLAHVLLGSTVERVVRYAPCPVLVVRQPEREFVA
jgi:nucleotide-binding universal stress UspA family protein